MREGRWEIKSIEYFVTAGVVVLGDGGLSWISGPAPQTNVGGMREGPGVVVLGDGGHVLVRDGGHVLVLRSCATNERG
ncbi:hypothetical protein TNCV_456501 [Trichonephila clavipes]|uniref:Uncharacterized protein n=1 Tax=Trichonephila clavipes TaxID=2585209 RepID=A0A8X6UYL7_TRICX|nr:hypothetical protein TNCV_456501 [Trichonephila clavipes]